ncbi:MAG: ABC transporter permease [Burkholderiales bacterium]|nr:MAG: ABC transporter permease [Burkholderiales bacterium]
MPQPRHPSLRETAAFGGALFGRPAGWLRAIHFAAVAMVTALSPSAYDREARRVAARQIHFSAWQAVPGFTLACALLSFVLIRIVVGTAQNYGLPQYALELTVRVLVLELIPILAALFVALRSGAAISIAVTLMHVRGEFDQLARAGRDPVGGELVPRAIGSLVAVMLLSYSSGVVALALAYGELYGLSPWALGTFVRVTGQVFEPAVVVGFVLKTMLFGAAVGAIPIGAALGIRRDPAQAPIAVRRGMVRLGVALALIEIVFLAVMYA